MPTWSNAPGGSGLNFLTAGTFRWPSGVLVTAPLFTNRAPTQGIGRASGCQKRKRPPHQPTQTPHTSDGDAETPVRKGHVQGQTATSIQLTPVPSFPAPPAPKLPSTPSNVSDKQGCSIPFPKYSNLTSSRKLHCQWGEEEHTRKAGMSLGESVTVGRQVSLPIKIINEVRHLQQRGRQSHCEPMVFSASKTMHS